MVATIICGVVILIATSVITKESIQHKEITDITTIGIITNIIVGLLLCVSVGTGYDPNHKMARDTIIANLEESVNKEHIQQAQQWNNEVSKGNNYWCRFSIKNEEKIDIQYYVELHGEKR